MTLDELKQKAVAAQAAKDYETQCRYVAQATALEPGDPALWSQLGACYLVLGRGEEALDASSRALDLAPEDPRWNLLHCNLIIAVSGDRPGAERIAEAQRALERVERAVTQDPSVLEESLGEALSLSSLLNRCRASVWITSAVMQHGTPTADGKDWVPTSAAAVEKVEEAIEKARALEPWDEHLAQAVTSAEEAARTWRELRFVGSKAVVAASILIGLVLLSAAGSDANASQMQLGGVVYLLSGVLYLHAARVPGYRLVERGEELGAAHALAAGVKEEDGCVGGLVSFLVGFCLVGLLTPALVLYHYLRNYPAR